MIASETERRRIYQISAGRLYSMMPVRRGLWAQLNRIFGGK